MYFPVGGIAVAVTVDLQQDTVGVSLRVTLYQPGTTTPLALTGVSEIRFRMQKPDGTVIERTGTIYDADAGIVIYTTTTDDLTPFGRWKIQVHIDFSDGKRFKSSVGKFKVLANI